ncbi:MAG TPA: hypothetical protein VMZ01_04870 [Aestuariivirga sp.]|nr:hypothetical protein [Aestuariivirga sp.]
MAKPAIIRMEANVNLEPWPDFPESEISFGDRGSRGHLWIDEPKG